MKRSLLYLPFLLLAISFSLLTLHCGADSSSSSPNLGLSTQGCGSGAVDAGESCDDGNTENSDGCNAHCAWEVGEATCGNGILENEECCDDGNTNSGDGCSDTCLSEKNNHPPLAPLLSPNPANGVTWSPTRLYLSWSASTDSDPGDSLVYDVYFAEGAAEGTVPYKKDIRSTHFIIQASTDNRSEYFPDLVRPIYLLPNRTYTWKVCARDSKNASNCSERRVFNTDNSVVGWWRFDENPAGATCPSMPGVGGPAGDPGETVCDYSGFGNHGVPRGGPAWLPPIAGILGGGLQFDGVDDWVEITHSVSLTFNSMESISLETSVTLDRIPPDYSPFLVTKASGLPHGNYSLIVYGGRPAFTFSSSTDPTGITPIYTGEFMLLPDNNYRIIASQTFGEDLAKIMINGVVSPGSWSGGDGRLMPYTSGNSLALGRRTSITGAPSPSLYPGQMEEVIIYRLNLSPAYTLNSYLCSH